MNVLSLFTEREKEIHVLSMKGTGCKDCCRTGMSILWKNIMMA